MFRLIRHRKLIGRSRSLLAIVCMGGLLMLVSPACSFEEVDTWLEDRGMDQLLAEYLEQQLPGMAPQDRAETTLRLARLYARLLSQTEDRAQRVILEKKSRRLLEEVGGAAAESLRLELLHGIYLGIEDAAERHRLQLLDQTSQAETIERLRLLIAELDQLHARVDRLRDKWNNASGRMRARVAGKSQFELLNEMSSRIDFLSGWCHYYLGWLTGSVAEAELAERQFAGILMLDQLDPDEVSVDLRSSPAIAWTIIGMALTSSMTSSEATALRWLDLLDLAIVPEDIREQVPGWRLVVLLEHQKFKQALQLLKAMAYLPGGRPVSWVRLAAVSALAHAGQPEADVLASESLAMLASSGELGQIQNIAARYGDEIGLDSFSFNHARAIMEFGFAKKLEDQDPIAAEADRRHAWRLALKSIETALNSEDRGQYNSAFQQARLLKAWSIYYLQRYEEARDLFESVSQELKADDASESLWMAYVAEERRCVESPSIGTEELDRLVERYLERFPSGQRAGELMVRRASRGEIPSQERVDDFLQVPLGSLARPLARMRAADMLYRLYREAEPTDKPEAGAEYLSLAVPMMQEDDRTGGEVAQSRSVARARRVLEVATSPRVLRMVAADSAMRILRNRAVILKETDTSLDDELDYREVLMLLARNQYSQAQTFVDGLHQRNALSIWARLAARRMLERARQEINESEGDESRASLEGVVRNGEYVLSESPSLPEAIEVQSGQLVAFSVAEAAEKLWLMEGDSQLGDRAWELYGALLEVSPKNKSFLSGRGRLAASRGDTDEALRCWRIVTAGSRAGSDDWFQARTALIELLEASDPSRAREVMEQHMALYPEFGPVPWGERLRSAADRLGANVNPDDDPEALP
ncbi:MAG: hypothetical protein P8M22_03680 [Phycisphaerales bacterium]|nr:hypothetical protein [Phycisphaerales bacterium]